MWSTLKQRIADAHPVLRTVALGLALLVTLGLAGLFTELADGFYADALAVKDMAAVRAQEILASVGGTRP